MIALVPRDGTKNPILGVLAHGLYGEKSEKPLSSLLVFLNDWLNFRVRDQFEINAGP